MAFPSILRRPDLVAWLLLALATPALAANAVFHCERADNANSVPCTVRLVPSEPTKAVIEARPDKPVEIAPGRYEIRAGSPGFALASDVSFTAREVPPGSPSDRVRLSLVPGGSVYIDPSAVPSPGAVQLVSLSTGKADVLFVDREREIPVPAGKLVAVGLMSPGKFLGMTTVLPIKPGQKNVVQSFARPAPGRSNVFVRADYHGGSSQDPKDVAIALSAGAEKFESTAATNAAAGSHYSVFYGIAQGPRRIDVDSKRWRVTQADLNVAEPFVFKGDLVLVPKPSLTVRPIATERAERWNVNVYTCKDAEFGPGSPAWPSLEKCVSDPVTEGSGSEVVVHDLDARWYFVVVAFGKKRVGKQIDLRSGEDRQEDFDFQGRRVYGVVRQGDQGVAATLTFKNNDTGDRAEDVTSGPDGSYEQSLSQTGMYRVEIRIPGAAESETAVFQLSVGDEESIRRDFTIPSGRVTVTVSNEQTREPIRDASVGFLLAGASEERKTDESGKVTLPPLAPGTLRLITQANGYQRKDQNFEVLGTKTMQSCSVLLKPLDDGVTFRVLLPTGSPATSTTVLWGIDVNGGLQLRQRCDSSGTCRFAHRPADEETLFLVQREAGLTIVSAGTAFHDQQVQLLPVGGPLILNVRRGGLSATVVLSVKVIVAGVVVPALALETIANLVGETFRLFLYPGTEQSMVIAGLPAGTPLGVVVSPKDARSGNFPELPPTPIQLPAPGPLEVTVP